MTGVLNVASFNYSLYMYYCTILQFIVNVYYTVSQKNDTDVAGYIFNAHQPILIVFGR